MTDLGPTGSNSGFDSNLFNDDVEPTSDVAWLASGRDALALAAEATGAQHWFVPDFICAAVPETLRRAGVQVHPYTPGQLEAAFALRPTDSTAAVLLLWDLGYAPVDSDRAFAAEKFLVVEDRCLWVGLPHEVPSGTWAIGSVRKWTGNAGGGWLVGPTVVPEARGHNPSTFARVMLAASALRSVRETVLTDELEHANILLNEQAERCLGIPTAPRRASRLARLLAEGANASAQRAARARSASELVARLAIPPVPDHSIGVRIRSRKREEILVKLRERRVYATVHWRDGDWCGRAASLAAETLTIPLPALATHEQASTYAGLVGEVLEGHQYEI